MNLFCGKIYAQLYLKVQDGLREERREYLSMLSGVLFDHQTAKRQNILVQIFLKNYCQLLIYQFKFITKDRVYFVYSLINIWLLIPTSN